MVSPVNSTTVTVSWSEVRCFNGSGAVTHYLVQYHSMSGGIVQNVTTDDTVQTISDLTLNAAVYTFQVAAVETSGVTGPFSNPAIPGRCQNKTLYPAWNMLTYSNSSIQHYSLWITSCKFNLLFTVQFKIGICLSTNGKLCVSTSESCASTNGKWVLLAEILVMFMCTVPITAYN